jgi:hypothetical protein
LDGGNPPIGVALFGRQFTKHSDCIPNGRDNAVPAHQLECQFRGANQSKVLSGAALKKTCGHIAKCAKISYITVARKIS